MSNTTQTPSKRLSFLLRLCQAETKIRYTFDRQLLGGIGLTEFIVLQAIDSSQSKTLTRSELATAVNLSASGITRILLPMEKLGMIARKPDPRDKRISYVTLTKGGERILYETFEKAELLSDELVPTTKCYIEDLSEIWKYLKC